MTGSNQHNIEKYSKAQFDVNVKKNRQGKFGIEEYLLTYKYFADQKLIK